MSNPFAPPVPPAPGSGGPPAPAQGSPHFGGPGAYSPHAYPPAHYPQAGHSAAGQAWAAPQLGVPTQLGAPPKQGNGLAIAAIVMSGVALLGVIAVAGFFFAMASSAPGSGWVLEGEVTVVDKGVADVRLEQALSSAIEDDGGSVDEIRCPPRSQVGQGLVTVCRGSVDGWDWTGVVVFEDDAGSFIVTEY